MERATESQPAMPEASVRQFEASGPGLTSQLANLNPDVVAVQYVGYGYSPDGCPRWLPEALSRWRSGGSQRRLTVMFHELWADGPPWTRAFWSHRTQARIAVDLAKIADACLVSCARNRDLLAAKAGVAVGLQPVGSNIRVVSPQVPGEPGPTPAFKVLVFGLPGPRQRTLGLHRRFLASMEASGKLESVSIAGPGIAPGDGACPEAAELTRWIPRSRVRIAGQLTEEDLSKALSASDICLNQAPTHLLCKSGTAMAAFAHGRVVITEPGLAAAPLVPGEHFLVNDETSAGAVSLANAIDRELLGRVGRVAQRWYSEAADWPHVVASWKRALVAHE